VSVRATHRFPDALERIAAGVLLAAASPAIVTAALGISFLSRRAPLVAHLRVGWKNRPFWMLKLRTMWDRGDAACSPGARAEGWLERIVAESSEDRKDPRDPRITSRFAAFCRRHSIDELPQLWHVVRGEMSLVGPRPVTCTEVARYYGRHAAELLAVKPGLTGLWQVQGRSAIRFPERVALDLELVRTLTPGKYLSILARTLPALIHGRGAW
jgi:exopolysaccharide production protein ExoY